MNVAFVITNLAGGGAEKVVINLTTALVARGHQVQLILLEPLMDYAAPAGVPVHVLPRLSKGAFGKRFAALRLRRLMRQLARHKPFDIIISSLPFANEVSILAKLPRLWCRIDNTLSVEIERLRADNPRKANRRLERYRRLYRTCPLIAVSDGVADDLRVALGLKDSRIERIYNPFDFSAIRARASEFTSLPDGPYVIHVGRFVPQKRHDVLLDAWLRVRAPHRLILLTHPDADLNKMIEARGLAHRVIVAGFQSNPYAWIAGADLLVLSSDHEGLPGVIIEALAVGTPVVSTDCPSGPREILSLAFPECLVPSGDAAALAHAIDIALSHRPDVTLADLSPFAIEKVVADYERLGSLES
jgi:glycosyltransferase involved in cell wall biosynthesis